MREASIGHSDSATIEDAAPAEIQFVARAITLGNLAPLAQQTDQNVLFRLQIGKLGEIACRMQRFGKFLGGKGKLGRLSGRALLRQCAQRLRREFEDRVSFERQAGRQHQ